jgi:membrane-associated protease RseP (regulator of RpoE activity)
MSHRILLCLALLSLAVGVQAAEVGSDRPGENWNWGYGVEEGGSGSSYLGVDIADVTTERLSALKLKEEHGAEVTMVDQDAPAGKAGLKDHDVILSLNGAAVESAAQLRRMIRETPAGRIVTLGISRDGQPQSIKVQLAGRSKGMAMHNMPDIKIAMPAMPAFADMDIPVSVVIAHSSLRSGLMVENITAQLGEFFGVKNGNGVLVRSVEKGSRSEKAGFHAGDVIVKVNNQPVHDTSDFTRALRATSNGTAAVTVVRDRKEQNLNLTLPDKKDSGILLEESFDLPEVTADVQIELSRAGEEIARMAPALEKLQRNTPCFNKLQQKLQDSQKKLQQRTEKMRHEFSGEWTEI